MLAFIGRILRWKKEAENKRNAEAKAWLDDMRRNELSLGARRRLAPDEAVGAPHIGHGSAAAVTSVPMPARAATATVAGRTRPAAADSDNSVFDNSSSTSASEGSDACADDASSCSDSGAAGGSD